MTAPPPDDITRLARLSLTAALVDSTLARHVGSDEEHRALLIESHLRRFMADDWTLRGRRAAKSAARAALAGTGSFGDSAAETVERAVAGEMKLWSDDVRARVLGDVEIAYGLGRYQGASLLFTGVRKAEGDQPNPFARHAFPFRRIPPAARRALEILTSFDVIDQAAVSALRAQQLLWIGDLYERDIGATIRRVVEDLAVRNGRSRAAVARELETTLGETLGRFDLPSGFRGTASSYFEVLASAATHTARVDGNVMTLSRAGIERYRWRTVEDERVCFVCGHMDGKVFTIESALGTISRALAAATPDAVKEARPWLGARVLRVLSSMPGAAGKEDSDALVEVGFNLPPAHGRCRCGLEAA